VPEKHVSAPRVCGRGSKPERGLTAGERSSFKTLLLKPPWEKIDFPVYQYQSFVLCSNTNTLGRICNTRCLPAWNCHTMPGKRT
jgi:hypothetical protein